MPVSDELLLKLIYKEENQKALSDASAQLETMTQAEKDLIKQNAALADSGENLAKSSEGIAGGFSKAQAALVTFQAGIAVVKEGIGMIGGIVDATIGKYERYSRQVLLLSNNLGLSAEETSRLIQVSDDYGISVDTVTSALQMMVRRGTAPSIEELAKIADQYVAIEDPTKRAALMTDLLGRGWTSLTPLLKDGGQAIRDNAKAISDSLIITEADIKKTEELRKAKDELNDRVEGLSLKLGGVLAPAENKVVDSFSAWLELLTPATTEEERLRQVVISTANTFGENSIATQEAANKLREYLMLMKQVGMTDQERLLRSNMGRISNLSENNPQAATNTARLSDEDKQAAIKAYGDFQTQLTSIETKGDAEREKIVDDAMAQIDKLESDSAQKRLDIISKFSEDEANRLSDMRDKQVNILTSYSEAEQQITNEQNKNRLALARSYGVEAERAEEDHQRAMQRMTEDHTRRLSKLADSRDALGIEDEQSNYELEARRAEEDYQTTAQRRSEDYAQQLADLNAAAEEQRQARAREKDKQLADLADQFAKQDERYQTAYQKQLADLDRQTEASRREMQNAEAKKLADQRTAQQSEHDAAVTQWTQWRNEHQIFFEGEKKLYDDYLKHLDDQLRVYIGSSGASTTSAGSTSSLGHKAGGGSVDAYHSYVVGENGPEILRMGGRGGYVEANGGMPNITLNIGPVNGGDPKTLASELKPMIHDVIIEVFQAAHK